MLKNLLLFSLISINLSATLETKEAEVQRYIKQLRTLKKISNTVQTLEEAQAQSKICESQAESLSYKKSFQGKEIKNLNDKQAAFTADFREKYGNFDINNEIKQVKDLLMQCTDQKTAIKASYKARVEALKNKRAGK